MEINFDFFYGQKGFSLIKSLFRIGEEFWNLFYISFSAATLKIELCQSTPMAREDI